MANDLLSFSQCFKSLQSLHAIMAFLIFAQSFAPVSASAAPLENAMIKLFGERTEIRPAKGCHVYLAPSTYVVIDSKTQTSVEGGRFAAGDPNIPSDAQRWPQNASGFKLANSHDLKDLRTALQNLINDVGVTAVDGNIVVKDAPHPLFNEFAKDYMRELDNLFAELNIDPTKIKISFAYKPSDSGIQSLLEKWVHWWPQALPSFRIPFLNKKWPQVPYTEDYDPPIGVETKKAVPIVLASEVSTAVAAVAGFWGQPEIYVPVLTGHFILLTAVVAYSRTIANWLSRSGTVYSDSRTIAGIQNQMNLFLKGVVFSALFVGNFKLWGNSAETLQMWTDSTLLEFAKNSVTGVWEFASGREGLTTLLQSAYYHATFNNGIFRWESNQSQDPRKQEIARDTKAGLTGLLYLIGGPVVLFATLSSPEGGGLNWGQISLIVMTATFGGFFSYAANRNPALIDDYVSPFVINHVNPPLNFIAQQMRNVVEPPMNLGISMLDSLSRFLGLKKK